MKFTLNTKTFYNLQNNKIINIQHPLTVEALETLKNDLAPEDYFISDENLEKRQDFSGLYDEHRNPLYEISGGQIRSIADSEILSRNKTIYKNKLSAESFAARQKILPDYKQVNAALGVYDDTTKTRIKNCIEAFRAESYRVFALIDAAENMAELDAAYNGNGFKNIEL